MTRLTWTADRPTQAGWYWWRDLSAKYEGDRGPEVFKVRLYGAELSIGNCSIEAHCYAKGEWAGPIPEPEEGAVGG